MRTVPESQIKSAYKYARSRYAALGVDADAAIRKALSIPVSIHCWQADDVGGFEVKADRLAGSGTLATGNYPFKARNGDEIRQDVEKVLELTPGTHKLNLHACYAETDGARIDRDELAPVHFEKWIEWAKRKGLGLDFNTTFFAHPKANDGYTLSHPDAEIRKFWIDHAIACRKIAEHMGKALGQTCVLNHWIPDGAKDSPADRWSPRERLLDSYERIFAGKISRKHCVEAIESKLFGIGSEDYVVGSYELLSGYALKKGLVLCLDMGHFHPTETLADKVSSLLQLHDKLLLHTSRGVRWDSDHVVLFNDDVRSLFTELARGNAMDRVYVALDFFDASINRIGAYVIGLRSTRKALLSALLDPVAALQGLEREGKLAQKLALMEETRTLPFGAVWDMLCLQAGVAPGEGWIDQIESYERDVLSKRV